MKWVLFAFFAGMTLSVAVPRHLATLEAVTHETNASATVTYPGGETASGYLVLPQGGTPPHPAILVIHDWRGLNDDMKANTRRLAVVDDCVVLAPDLYRGKTTTTPELARSLTSGTAENRVIDRLVSAIAYLKSRRDVDSKRIGVIGWGMGGDYALALMLTQTDLKAAVVCSGRPVGDAADLEGVGASVLGIYGGRDPDISVESTRKFEQRLLDLDKTVEMVIYPQAGHAFMSPADTDDYREDDARNAWSRIHAFFAFRLAQ